MLLLPLFINADYDNRVQDDYQRQKYHLRTWSLLSTSHPRRYTVGKKHMKELKNKFDMGFNEINHKIHMKVKRLSSHHQSFITIHVRIQTSYIPGEGGSMFQIG
jgi:hypothetical protein